MSVAIMIAVAAAVLAVLYGLVMSKWISNLPAGKCTHERNSWRHSTRRCRLFSKTI